MVFQEEADGINERQKQGDLSFGWSHGGTEKGRVIWEEAISPSER